MVTVFLSTYPVRGTTHRLIDDTGDLDISIHVPRAGYDGTLSPRCRRGLRFLSTYPVRGTTESLEAQSVLFSYFYPRTPCGVRRSRATASRSNRRISIHVPRAGYDVVPPSAIIKAPVFLSTYPVRGTTGIVSHDYASAVISIHVPRAGYDTGINRLPRNWVISIHVPRAGYDRRSWTP